MVILIYTLVIMINVINSEARECLESPILYGVSKVGYRVECSCIIDLDDAEFKFNMTDVWWVGKDNTEDIPFIINKDLIGGET